MGLKFGIHIMRGIPRQAVHRNTRIYGTTARARDIASQFSLCPWNTDMYGVDTEKEGPKNITILFLNCMPLGALTL